MSTGTVLQSTSQPQPVVCSVCDTALRNAAAAQKTHDDTPSIHAGHSGKLVYAKPEDLPSFPSIGLLPNGSAASAAATLGWSSKKSPEIWKPDSSNSASTAALLAQSRKMPAAATPSPSSHGAQAALLAHKAAQNSETPKLAPSDHGHSAANQAFKSGRTPNLAPNDRATTLNRQRSLMAAKGAMNVRPRSNTAPSAKDEDYPDKSNAASNALKAATAVHKAPRPSSTQPKGGAVPFTTMNRQMFTSHPPVKPEVEEQSREDQLHASAVAMAKKMFTQQQKVIDQTKKAHGNDSTSLRRTRSINSMSSEEEVRPMQFNNLQDAAYKLAQERLAKLHEDHLKTREYQEYYGQSGQQKQMRRFSVRGKLTRRRSNSDGDVFEDRKRSQDIKKQMSIFNSKLSQVDTQKRQQDRDALLAVAQKNVQARMKGIDDKISAETGMVPPSSSTSKNWEAKAHAAAQSRSEDRMTHHGKVDIGAGKFMTQEEIDAIAAANVKPTLDEINEKAEKEHARLTELRLEAEAKKEAHEREKAREREVAAVAKKLKEQDRLEQKEKKAEEKHEAKLKKEEEKMAHEEEKRLGRSRKHNHSLSGKLSLNRLRRSESAGDAAEDRPATAPLEEEEQQLALNDVGQPVRLPTSSKTNRVSIPAGERQTRSESSSPTDKTSQGGKVKTWFKHRFSRGSFSRGSRSDDEKPSSSKRGFIGGHALTGLDSNNASVTSLDGRSSSMRAIAMAGRRRTGGSEATSAGRRSTANADDVSPMSSSDDEDYDEAVDHMGTELSPPRHIQDPAKKKSHSPVKDSRFLENL